MPTNHQPHNRQNLPENTESTPVRAAAKISMIATPIGNLSDLSVRAREALSQVDELWCEDTRHTQNLLHALGIKGQSLRRIDQHTSQGELRMLLERVRDGRLWVGVVTDAGTPGLSDPGALIGELIEGFPEINLEPVPGASALSAMVSIGGLSGSSLVFCGFFPRTEDEALELLSNLKNGAVSPNWVFFESPHRISQTLTVLEKWCGREGVEPRFVFSKELTKVHETTFRGAGAGFLKSLQEQRFDERGEWVFAMILPKGSLIKAATNEGWEIALECLIEAGVSAKTASQLVSGRFSVAKNLAYKAALEFKKK